MNSTETAIGDLEMIDATLAVTPHDDPLIAELKQDRDQTLAILKGEASWPTLDQSALHGLAGDFVRTVEPHTESDPVALLVQFVLGFGSVVGRGPHFLVEADCHGLNENVCLAGDTAKGRKGTSQGRVRSVYRAVDGEWDRLRVLSGLSSGEGLIVQVRDPVESRRNGETVILDEGEPDKRLLVVEAEFASTLRVMAREGNTLSPVLRRAWDGETVLRSLTKNSPTKATGAHVSIIAHVTADELRKYLTRSEMGNGFANRFLWVCVRRSKFLPNGGRLDDSALSPLIDRLTDAVEFARTVGRIERDAEAQAAWEKVYSTLSGDRPGLLGAVTGRAEAHVVRLSCLYALLDSSPVVRLPHLLAALALWEYCDTSARRIFGDSIGNPDADFLLHELRRVPEGLTRSEISGLFGRNLSATRINQILATLAAYGLARPITVETDGRPAERWFAVTDGTKETNLTK